MWVHMPCSNDTIIESWDRPKCGSPAHILPMKSKKTKEVLRHWSKEERGNIFHKSVVLHSWIEHLETKEVAGDFTSNEFETL